MRKEKKKKIGRAQKVSQKYFITKISHDDDALVLRNHVWVNNLNFRFRAVAAYETWSGRLIAAVKFSRIQQQVCLQVLLHLLLLLWCVGVQSSRIWRHRMKRHLGNVLMIHFHQNSNAFISLEILNARWLFAEFCLWLISLFHSKWNSSEGKFIAIQSRYSNYML